MRVVATFLARSVILELLGASDPQTGHTTWDAIREVREFAAGIVEKRDGDVFDGHLILTRVHGRHGSRFEDF